MDRISISIIAKDEAEHLRQLLPMLGWADEVVVLVDARTQDNTAEVASAHGCRVKVRPFDTYAGQRNAALEMARGDWIFCIDADERPMPGLAEELRQRLAQSRVHGFRTPIQSWIFGRRLRWGGVQEDRPVRLVRQGWGRWEGAVHERLRVHGRVATLHRGLRHWSTPDLHTYFTKMYWYSALEACERVGAGRPPKKGEAWRAAFWEVFRRLCWKGGILDGPVGWAFCLLSGLNAWCTARRHDYLWQENARM